jgi:hypothetical protein
MVLPGRPGLAGYPIAPPGLHRTIALAHRRGVQPTRAAAAFRETLLGHIRVSAASGLLPPGVQSLVAG